MKISIYTFFIEDKNKYIYNSLSNSFARIPDALFFKLKQLGKMNEFSESDLSEDEETVKQLQKAKILTMNDVDDLLSIRSAIYNARTSREIFNITIAPTLDCNYSCYYCFEDNYKAYITDDVIEGIVKFINKQSHLKHINITWFGGEPLMAFKKMKTLYGLFKLPECATMHTSIITNGYYMDKSVVDQLEHLKINHIQLSIDGVFDQYNEVKNMDGDKNCFAKIVDNIDYFAKRHENINMMIRVNLNKNNKNNYLNAFYFFKKRYPNNGNIYIYPAFLKTNKRESCKSKEDCFSNNEEIMNFSRHLYAELGDKTLLYPGNNFGECAVRNSNSIGFGPDGAIYKCWENIGDIKNSIGKIDRDGNINITNITKLNRYLHGADPFSDSKCQQCSYLPICFGGCPHARLAKVFDDENRGYCTVYKGNIHKYVEHLIEEDTNEK